eukprot:SAG31_NODE_2572_length_5459_cov_3.008396_2_plen_822_part_00
MAALAVVENDNGRIQIVMARSGAAMRIVQLVGQNGAPVQLHSPGGCVTVSDKWARESNQRQQGDELGLLAIPSFAPLGGGNGYVHIIHLPMGVVQHTLEVPEPTCVAEPQPGVLAVTDRTRGRVLLFRCVDGSVSVSVAVEGLERPVGCAALGDGGFAVTDTGRGRVMIMPASACELHCTTETIHLRSKTIPSAIEDVEYESQMDGSTERYVAIWPAGFNPDTATPADPPRDLLMALHGHGSDRWQFVNDSRGECAGLREIAKRRGMLYVSPDYRAPSSWMGPAAEADVAQMLSMLREKLPIDRVILAGGSMGATAALSFAVLHPDLIDGVISLNGLADLVSYENFSEAITESYGGSPKVVARERMLRSAELRPARLAGLALASTTGGRDESVPPDSVLRLVSSLERRLQDATAPRLDKASPVLSIDRPQVGHETGLADTAAAAEFVLATLDSRNINLRGSFVNSLRQFEAGTAARVAFIGGSITQMDGYRPMVCAWLKGLFPSTSFDFVDAGISSTCSTTGAFRLENDVLQRGKIDLLFVEFAVNDDQDAMHARRECIRGVEGIVRHARTAQPDIDIVVTHFINEGMLEMLQAGETPVSIAAHESVLRHYSIASVFLAREVAQRIAAGSLTWEGYGGVHPAPEGNKIAANMIAKMLATAWCRDASDTAALHTLPASLVNEGSYCWGRWLSPEPAANTHWVYREPDWAQIEGGFRDTFFAGLPLLCCDTIGAETTIAFAGSMLGAFVLAGPDAAMVECSVDGGAWVTAELFHRFSVALHYPRTVSLASELGEGPHEARLRLVAQQATGQTAARILQFAVNA